MVQTKQRKRDMRFGAWDVRNLNVAAALPTAAREIWRYKLDLVGVQEVGWDRGGTVRAGDYNVFYGKRNHNHRFGTGCFVHHSLERHLRE